LAVAMYPQNLKKEKHDEALAADITEARMNYMQAYLQYAKAQGLPVYADANSTLRVTYGNVMGYQPKDAVYYEPFTTLAGILEKDTGKEPFDAPEKELKAIKSKDYGKYIMQSLQSVPVNFLSDLDITGGNSGSPTLDSKGHLVGLAFDGNYESINADWIFNKDLARTIHVDIRYILWIMDKIDHADRLLHEMRVK
ncbi:MAG TPA: S46 family peptidase, partial [Oceanospirillales bacterium]|nr:S46 family peptidase [Oceanospirillales bacterium]